MTQTKLTLTRLLPACLLILGLLGNSAAVGNPVDGEKLFKKRCQTCHKLPDPDKPPGDGWTARLNKMAPLAGLKTEQKQSILEFLNSHAQEQQQTGNLINDRQLFEQKCSVCHTLERVASIPVDQNARHHILERMQQRIPGLISSDEAERILNYLSTATPDEILAEAKTVDAGPKVTDLNNDGKLSEQELFLQRCSSCHTLERVFQKSGVRDAEAWAHIVQRMRDNAGGTLSESEAAAILHYLQGNQNP